MKSNGGIGYATDPEIAAEEAGLRYVQDGEPGFSRRRAGRGFSYRDTRGEPITDRRHIRRIKSLAIPPAWADVWICPFATGHIQATGRDGRGRKQYRYHPRWREVRDETKYHRILDFGRALPRIRKRVDADLSLRGLPREKVLATVLRLLEASLIRVGNDEYARENRTYGLTTLRDGHVDVGSTRMVFRFRGKTGKVVEVDLRDRRLARIVKACQDLPGQELFQFVDGDGEQHVVKSQDVNEYLRAIAGDEFTAKDFRTWAGTVLAAYALREFEAVDSEAAAKRNVTRAIERVASRLGNTTAICRKCYVHPEVVNAYMDGTLAEQLKSKVEKNLRTELDDLEGGEAAVLAFLQQRLTREVEKSGA